jgi:sn-glycerol 3-phosphate transport system ATP-binding protein
MTKACSVEYHNVGKAFSSTPVLDSINLYIRPGEFTVFVGPSGSGKTTLLRILAGLESPDRGEVIIDGEEVTRRAPKDRDVAMVFQNYALYPHMTVERNITFGMRIRKEPARERERALREVAAMLSLEELLERKPRQLSGGQRQRVAMARAIVRKPKVFLMDEPLSNLDAKLRNTVRSSIIELQRSLGITTVYVTHDQVEAMTMADRMVVLNHGRIQQTGAPEELYRSPANVFVAGFVGTPNINFMPARYHDSMLHFGDSAAIAPDKRLCALLEQARNEEGECRVLAGLRPSQIKLHADLPEQGAEADLARIPVLVTGREMLGAEYIVQLRDAEGTRLQAVVSSSLDVPRIGEQTLACFTLGALHFFHPRTEERLIPAEEPRARAGSEPRAYAREAPALLPYTA